MHLIKVNSIRPQPAKAAFNCAPNVFRLRSLPTLTHAHTEFCREDHAIAPVRQRPAQKLFAFPSTVNVRRIQEVHPGIESRVNHSRGTRLIGSPAEVITSEARDGDLE